MKKRTLCLTLMVALICLGGVTGCVDDLGQMFYQTGASLTRTAVDLWLTDLVNTLVGQDDDNDADEPDDGEDPDDGDTDGPDFEGLTGDPAAGEDTFADAGCAMCHGDDGSTGIPILGATAEALHEYLRGEAAHTKLDLGDQAIVDLATYLDR